MMEFEYTMESYLQTLVSCREGLKGSPLLDELDKVIAIEIEMAMMGSTKALAECKKDDNVFPLKKVDK